jgi:hypothetical protein
MGRRGSPSTSAARIRIFVDVRAPDGIERPTMNELRLAPEDDHLYERVTAFLDEARSRVARLPVEVDGPDKGASARHLFDRVQQ